MKRLIFEELEKILNETTTFTDEKLNFQQEITNVSYQNYETFSSEYDSKIIDSNIQINWRVGFKTNSFGIEKFIIDIVSVQGAITLTLHDKQSDEIVQETNKNIEDLNWTFKYDAVLNKGGSLYVSDLIFDFKNQICIVNFL